MKKYLALFLALAMLLLCAACGGNNADTPDDAATTPPAEGTNDAGDAGDADDAGEPQLVLVAEESGEGFPCVLLDNGSIFWVKGITSTEEIQNLNDLKDAPQARIEVVGNEIRVIGDEIPDWLEEDEEMVQIILDAMAEWEVAPEADLDNLTKPAVELAGPTATDAESTEGGRMFACAVLDNGHVVWEQDVTLPSELGEEGDNVALCQVIHLPNNAWELMVIGEIPDWFDDSVIQNVTDAFNQWMDADSGEGGPDMNDPNNQDGPDMNDPNNQG